VEKDGVMIAWMIALGLMVSCFVPISIIGVLLAWGGIDPGRLDMDLAIRSLIAFSFANTVAHFCLLILGLSRNRGNKKEDRTYECETQ